MSSSSSSLLSLHSHSSGRPFLEPYLFAYADCALSALYPLLHLFIPHLFSALTELWPSTAALLLTPPFSTTRCIDTRFLIKTSPPFLEYQCMYITSGIGLDGFDVFFFHSFIPRIPWVEHPPTRLFCLEVFSMPRFVFLYVTPCLMTILLSRLCIYVPSTLFYLYWLTFASEPFRRPIQKTF